MTLVSAFVRLTLITCLLLLETTNAYVPRLPIHFRTNRVPTTTTTALNYVDDQAMLDCQLPSLQQVTTDSFTDQTYHATTIVNELVTSLERSQTLQDLVSGQLSHKDGIQGFFAVYLARSAADVGVMPGPLSHAIKGVNMEKLAPVACMNVIRPTAMAAWHTDSVLKKNSVCTAHRAKKVLECLRGSVSVVKNCQAIYAVASGSVVQGSQSKVEEFWIDMLHELEYDREQRLAIAAAFSSFVQP